MSVQHRDIPDAQIHEPKGVATASQNSVYTANGAGSGVWAKISSLVLQGLTGDSGQANYKLVSNGANGFKLIKDVAYAQMGINGNTNSFTVTAATDATLNTTSDYALLTGTGAPWTGGEGQDVGFTGNQLTVGPAGLYQLSLVATVNGFPASVSKVAFKLRLNGNTFVPRKAIVQSQISAMSIQGMLNELVTLSANDVIQVYIASSAVGSVTIGDLSLIATLIKAA